MAKHKLALLAAALLLGGTGLAGCGDSSAPSGLPGANANSVDADFHTLRTPPLASGEFELITLSTLPDTVTGGDVLIALRGLAAADTLSVTRNGTAVASSAFSRLPSGEARGLVTGLAEGANTLTATATGPAGTRSATLTVTNHPITGPVLSGPHQTPFICRTADAGLGAPLDANCSIATRYQWFYRSSLTQRFNELTDPAAPYPADTQRTVTSDGRAVPFVVRVESATINRGIARISVLDDPHARAANAPFDAAEWNRRVYYAYGESCAPGYQQGVNEPSYVLGGLPSNVSGSNILITLVGIDQRLGKGDVIVHSTLSAYGVHCNPLISIETAMMIKEHINEQYGLIDDVVGTNGSGAALQQYNAINSAPGLLSAAMPTATFADIVTTAMTVGDCGLLAHYYDNSALNWTLAKRAAVDGHLPLPYDAGTCRSWQTAFLPLLDPAAGCDGAVPQAMRYNAASNPRGVRCTLQDANINIFGRDPATGFARRPIDNIGVQYGLAALARGEISADEFLDVNRNIGGFDIDGQVVAARMRMDPEVEAISYRIGGVLGRGALAETPVMDIAPYLDLLPLLNIHEAVRPFVVRARMARYTGQTATQALWRGVLTQPDAYPVMEQWFPSLKNLPYGVDHVRAVQDAKPAAAQDKCVFGTLGGRLELPSALLGPLGLELPLLPLAGVPGIVIPLRVDVPERFDSPNAPIGPCQTLLPVTATPRMVAGMPLTDDIIKCQLRAPVRSDYPATMTDAQFAQVQTIFPEGVCDFTRPDARDVARSLIWPSIGGRTLEAPHELKWRVARSSAR